ncbi:MAG: hypothetical protein JF570_13455 [Caulobacter sp.]|jgi:hypothetical protein|nr:hypothetical protein [Caulobacter sp.]
MKFFAATLCIATLAFAGASHASNSTEGGYITEFFIMEDGQVLFNVAGGRTTPPACQGDGLASRWAFNAATPAGQAKLSALLSAYALHKQVVIIGKGACSDWGDTESVSWFRIVN